MRILAVLNDYNFIVSFVQPGHEPGSGLLDILIFSLYTDFKLKMWRWKLKKLVIILLACIFLSGCSSPKLVVKDAWARPGIAGGTSAVYMLIENPLAEDDSLQSAACPEAGMTQIHMSSMDASGKMTMQEQKSVLIPASGEVTFQPGGLHVMLIDLKQDLTTADKIEVTLKFEKAGEMTLQVPIVMP